MAFLDIFSKFTQQSTARPSRVLGIDIGSSSIKVVELEDRNDVITLTTYGEIQLGPYDQKDIGQTVMLTPKQEQAALVDIIRESAVKARNSVVAIPLSSSFVTVMEIDAALDEDIGPRVRVEARKYIPVPISDITLDWAEIELPEGEQEAGNKREVLLAAIQNDGLERLRTLMSNVNMPNQPSEIECFSVIRGLTSETEQNVAIIDFGAVSSKLYIAKQGLLQRMHRVRAGGAICTSRLSKTLDLPFVEAERIKRSVKNGDEHYRDVTKVHESCFERSLHEFRKVIDEHEERHKEELDAVFITGGPVQFSPLQNIAEEIIERKVIIADPFTKVAYPAFMDDKLTEIGPTFSVAIGAAMRAFE